VTALQAEKSTIVRIIPSWLQAISHITFGALERLAPDLGARLALRMWLTPPHARRPAQQPTLPPGDRFVVPLTGDAVGDRHGTDRPARAGVGRAGVGRASVVAETWGTGPVVYLLHGWGGNRSHLAALVAPLVDAGMQVVALDAPGHGQSGPGHHGGRRTTLTEIADALTAVAAITGPAHAVISHSGGCAATGLAVLEGLTANRLVFVAPMAHPVGMLGVYAHVLGLGPRTERRLRQRLEWAAERTLAEFDLPARAAAADKLPPLLVIHDRDDREVPYAHGAALASAWPAAQLETTTGLGHRRLLADAAVVATVVSYLAHESVAGE
jgi:pimeloyl-ACP methyl ester carboxylesterase